MSTKQRIKMFGIILFYMILPNAIATLLQFMKTMLVNESTTARQLLVIYAFYGIAISLLLVLVFFIEICWIMRGEISSAVLIPIGLSLNVAINMLPIIFFIPVPQIFSFTYLNVIQFFPILIALLISSLILLKVSKEKL